MSSGHSWGDFTGPVEAVDTFAFPRKKKQLCEWKNNNIELALLCSFTSFPLTYFILAEELYLLSSKAKLEMHETVLPQPKAEIQRKQEQFFSFQTASLCVVSRHVR